MTDLTDLNNRYNYHAPDDEARNRHQMVREMFKDVATALRTMLPESREASLAETNLEQAMFWANAAIARMDETGARRR